MRVEAGKHWADIKDVDDLVAADRDLLEDAYGLSFAMPADGATNPDTVAAAMASVTLDYGMIHRQRDALLAAVITGWSLGIALPSEDITSAKRIPLTLLKALEDATKPHSDALARRPDPKEGSGATTSNSNGSSRARAPHQKA